MTGIENTLWGPVERHVHNAHGHTPAWPKLVQSTYVSPPGQILSERKWKRTVDKSHICIYATIVTNPMNLLRQHHTPVLSGLNWTNPLICHLPARSYLKNSIQVPKFGCNKACFMWLYYVIESTPIGWHNHCHGSSSFLRIWLAPSQSVTTATQIINITPSVQLICMCRNK